ncbi:MAG: DUF805 domain-containing protein [Actinomycetes bacterium]
MGFGEALQKGMSNIGNFEGRATRPEFWWFVLGVWIVEFVVVLLVSAVFRGGFGSFLTFVIWVVAFLAILSVAIRRLHDVGQSGWMAILWFIPCVFLIPLYFAIQPSQGPNQFGPPPA